MAVQVSIKTLSLQDPGSFLVIKARGMQDIDEKSETVNLTSTTCLRDLSQDPHYLICHLNYYLTPNARCPLV